MVSFIPGPSQLFLTVPDHLRVALKDGVPSLSHRSKAFEAIYSETADGLRTLLRLSSGFHIAFVSSATEIWERSIQSLVERTSFHAVNGAFSRRYYEVSKILGRQASAQVTPDGTSFDTIDAQPGQELIALTHNETSTGVSLPGDLFRSVRKQHPEALIIIDAVSSLPYVDLDYTCVDSVFFSVQKGFGLPAGLGVWIYNDRCVEKATRMQAAGKSAGTHHSLVSLHSFALKNQTPSTPNVLAIYLLGKVTGDFLRRGISKIRHETEYKAAIVYQALEKHQLIKPFVKQPAHRSQTVITVTAGQRISDFAAVLESKGLHPGEGYGTHKQSQLRFANFPAHSKETYELLVDTISSF